MPKYEPAPPPSKLEHVIEFLARELRRLAGHTHEERYWDDMRAPASITRPGAGQCRNQSPVFTVITQP